MRTPASIEARDFTRGINWSAKVSIGETGLLDWPPVKKEETPSQAAKPASVPGKSVASVSEKLPDSTTWIDVDKSLGPLSVRRV